MAGSVRNVSVRFSAEIQGFQQAMAQAAASTSRVGAAADESSARADTFLGGLVQSANESRDAWDTAGASLLGIGTAAVGGLALAGKAAMDWESAWAGVTKTVDGTPEQMDELEASLRGLAKTLPATHEEIAGVAEAAGQLGVAREDVTGFTKTMIDLGETTNLSADEAATAIAQISNVMGTMEREGSVGVERFGATLVALGNAGASTEAEIVDMAQRIAGAAKLVGASESDVLALANAMASVGIESQLGGGVISRVMQRMYGDVKKGGEGLDNLAKVAGVSSKEFATAFETDPVRAVDSVVKGLSRVKESGGDVIQTMSDLGIKGTEETGVILRLAGAGDLLADSLKLGDEAWASNSALAEEAAKRYETTESKVKIAWNNIKDAAIDAGAVLLPVIAGVAESVAGMASAFGALPAPVKGVLSVLGGVVGVAALGVGAFLTLTPKILDTMQAFNRLAPAGGRARAALAGVGKAAGAAAAIATVTLILAKLAEADYMSEIDTGMGKVSNALAEISTSGPGASTALDEIFKDREGGDLINTVTDLESAIKRTFNKDDGQKFNDWGEGLMNSITGVKGSSHILAESFERLDAGLAELVSGGNADDAAKTFEQIKKTADEQGVSVEDLAKKFPQYADALKQADAESKGAASSGKKAAETIEDVGTAAEQAAEQAEGLVESLLGLNNVNISAADAQLGFDQAIADAAKNLDKAGAGVDYLNEATGAFNQTAADNLEMLNGIASQGNTVAQTVYDQTGSYDEFRKSLESSRQSLFDVAKAYYPTEEAAWAYVDSVMAIPPEMKTDVNITDNNTIQGVKDNLKLLHDAIQGTPDKTVTITEPMSPEVIAGLEALGYVVTHLPNGTIQVSEQGTDATGQKIDNTAGKRRIAAISAEAFTYAAEQALNYAARPRSSTVWQNVLRTFSDAEGPPVGTGTVLRATGGRLPGFADGGQLPTTGPGTGVTDGFLGISSAGVPLARVDAGEWIINGASSDRYNRELAAINAGTFPKLPGYANGARVGREYSAQQLGHAPSGAASAHTATLDATAVASAVSGAMSGWQPVVNIGGREFYGLMAETTARGSRR